MALHWNYYDSWRAAEVDCPDCKWHGHGEALFLGEPFQDLFELDCPKCGKTIAIVGWPTLEESRANWSKLSESQRKEVEERERFLAEVERRELRKPSQLPDIDARSFTLEWDFQDRGNTHDTLIKLGERVIFAETALFEGYRRFVEVAGILRARYGGAIHDLVPTERSLLYLYGDDLGAAKSIDDARKRIFLAQESVEERHPG
jgi:hypothetical protein